MKSSALKTKFLLYLLFFQLYLIAGFIFLSTTRSTPEIQSYTAAMITLFSPRFPGIPDMPIHGAFAACLLAGTLQLYFHPYKIHLTVFVLLAIFIQSSWKLFYYLLFYVFAPEYYGFHVLQTLGLMAAATGISFLSGRTIQLLFFMNKENVPVDFASAEMTTASPGKRLTHLISDTLLLALLSWSLLQHGQAATDQKAGADSGISLMVFCFILLRFFYYFLPEHHFGITAGKCISNSHVASIHGNFTQSGAIFRRSIIRLVPFNTLSFLFRANWHDAWSGTCVFNGISKAIPLQSGNSRPKEIRAKIHHPEKDRLTLENIGLITLSMGDENGESLNIQLFENGDVRRMGTGAVPSVQTEAFSRFPDNRLFMDLRSGISVEFFRNSGSYDEHPVAGFAFRSVAIFGWPEFSFSNELPVWNASCRLYSRIADGSNFDHLTLRLMEQYIAKAAALTDSWYFDMMVLSCFGMASNQLPPQSSFSHPKGADEYRQEFSHYLIQCIETGGRERVRKFANGKIYHGNGRKYKLVFKDYPGLPGIEFREIYDVF